MEYLYVMNCGYRVIKVFEESKESALDKGVQLLKVDRGDLRIVGVYDKEYMRIKYGKGAVK